MEGGVSEFNYAWCPPMKQYCTFPTGLLQVSIKEKSLVIEIEQIH